MTGLAGRHQSLIQMSAWGTDPAVFGLARYIRHENDLFQTLGNSLVRLAVT